MADTQTQEHESPSDPRGAGKERPVLVIAFPQPIAAPIPLSGEPIGRSWLDALRATDSEVSAKHTLFRRARGGGGGITVADAGSRNGTFVDGARLKQGETVKLDDGAVVRLGKTILVFREQMVGPLTPAPDMGQMVGPYGLRGIQRALEMWKERPPLNILILGETGTGKELLADALSKALARNAPTAVNVGAIPATMFEAQLFGHVQGAFSDAKRASRGIVASAEGGAVFLDEIGELPLDLQPKILRLLENREARVAFSG